MFGAPTGWIKLICKRYAFAVGVRRACKSKGFTLEKNGVFWWLGTNKSDKHNFTITCGDTHYSVKLVGVRNPAILFGFVDEHTYEIKDYTFALPHTMDGIPYVLKKKEPYRFPEDSIPCIVMVPHGTKVTIRNRTEQRDRQEIGGRDQSPEGTFFFGQNFLQFLKDQG